MKINIKNLELLDEFEKRTEVYEQLLQDLKKVNSYIQNFANLKSRILFYFIFSYFSYFYFLFKLERKRIRLYLYAGNL
jgi:hypothetical protein